MQEQTAVRQPDETICFGCGRVVKRDVRICPECGSRIVVGPEHAGAPVSSPGVWEQPVLAQQAARYRDTIGIGRYILNFILGLIVGVIVGGIIGLGLSYLLRRRGWLATWILLIPYALIAVAVVVLAVIAFMPR